VERLVRRCGLGPLGEGSNAAHGDGGGGERGAGAAATKFQLGATTLSCRAVLRSIRTKEASLSDAASAPTRPHTTAGASAITAAAAVVAATAATADSDAADTDADTTIKDTAAIRCHAAAKDNIAGKNNEAATTPLS
ncbi:hypothetical protein Vretimale_13875, partial [Volvox reticuliferus]